jgi:hypothetical protein
VGSDGAEIVVLQSRNRKTKLENARFVRILPEMDEIRPRPEKKQSPIPPSCKTPTNLSFQSASPSASRGRPRTPLRLTESVLLISAEPRASLFSRMVTKRNFQVVHPSILHTPKFCFSFVLPILLSSPPADFLPLHPKISRSSGALVGPQNSKLGARNR